MTFLSPYWLFAASSVLIPIAIHLWNKRQGKTVKVGSLRWLDASASQRWSSIRLSKVWLLLLRCLMLLLLAGALAQPVILQPPQTPQSQKSVYISPELLYQANTRQQLAPMFDTLLQRGYQLYTYTPEFTEITLEQWQQLRTITTDSAIQENHDYWDLLPVLAARHPQPKDSVWLFTSSQQRYFAGKRPDKIPAHIRWLPISTEKTAMWLQTAVRTSPDSLLVVAGQARPEGILYSRHLLSAKAESIELHKQQLSLQHQQDTLRATFPDKSIQHVLVRTKPLQVALLAEERQQPELRYLQAALRAISSYTQLPIHTTTTPDTASDWVFWLRDEAVPPALLQKVTEQELRLWVQPSSNPTISQTHVATAGEKITVHQRSPEVLAHAQSAIWATTDGEALLTVQPMGKGHLYRFRSGFSPAWSSLGQSTLLPELLLPLLFPQPSVGMYDVRAMDERQLLPSAKMAVSRPALPEDRRVPLLPWLVSTAFVLFLIERALANRRATI